MFNERIMKRFTNPKYAGGLRGANGTGKSGDSQFGDLIKIYISVNEDNATLSTNIVNLKGILLPSTGGIGTTIFYVLGTILVLGAGILLVTRKRMSKSE